MNKNKKTINIKNIKIKRTFMEYAPFNWKLNIPVKYYNSTN